MKRKAIGWIGTLLGVVSYFFLKELFVNIGFNSFIAIILAVFAVIVIVYILGFILNKLKSDEQKSMEKEIQDDYTKEVARKQNEDENQEN